MDGKTGMVAIALGVLTLAPAFAQTTPPAMPGSRQTVPEKDATRSSDKLKEHQAPSTIQDGRSDSLSSKLSRSGGVIAPKGDMDPGIRTQAPITNPNSTPVIPPSATGGDSAK